MLNARGAVRGCSNGTRRTFDVPGWTGIAVGSAVCRGLALWIWLRGSLVITKIATYMTHSRLKKSEQIGCFIQRGTEVFGQPDHDASK